ncbi:hypothetical protein HJC99_03070 [Candidatus Saccharibacteria bacterium]|nr:hypothetical protein [Candidatus Saccharibacteria bacterium]
MPELYDHHARTGLNTPDVQYDSSMRAAAAERKRQNRTELRNALLTGLVLGGFAGLIGSTISRDPIATRSALLLIVGYTLVASCGMGFLTWLFQILPNGGRFTVPVFLVTVLTALIGSNFSWPFWLIYPAFSLLTLASALDYRHQKRQDTEGRRAVRLGLPDD